jgi:DNA-binding HxlR family transcriptional regulator
LGDAKDSLIGGLFAARQRGVVDGLRLMQPLSSKVLTEQLKELQGDHLIEREAFPGKVPKVVYG